MNASILSRFFNGLGQGVDAVLPLFDPEAVIVAVRDDSDPRQPIYGTYRGHDGVRRIVAALGASFETELFEVEEEVEIGDLAFASGRFRQRLRATGKPFESAWALRARLKDGLIVHYQFYEDSERLSVASAA